MRYSNIIRHNKYFVEFNDWMISEKLNTKINVSINKYFFIIALSFMNKEDQYLSKSEEKVKPPLGGWLMEHG